MNFKEYNDASKATAIYPDHGSGHVDAVNYCIVGLVGEVGEIANKFKKVLRGDYSLASVRQMLLEELGGSLWYANRLAEELGGTLEEVAENNAAILASRKERGVLQGNGDNR